jgi:hypothetical protein
MPRRVQELYPNATTPELYQEYARAASHRNRKISAPAPLPYPDVFLESDDVLRLKCSRCGNYPAVDPEWALGCCYECGLIYSDVTLPE